MTSTRAGIPRCRTHRRTTAADNFTMETYYYGRRSILTGRPVDTGVAFCIDL